MEAIVDIWVIDQSFPANRRSWFLKIGSHDNEKIIIVSSFQLEEAIGIVKRGGRIMYRAGANNDKQAAGRIRAMND